jgi:hypothetical protein
MGDDVLPIYTPTCHDVLPIYTPTGFYSKIQAHFRER